MASLAHITKYSRMLRTFLKRTRRMMVTRLVVLLILLFTGFAGFAQQCVIHGYVKDATTKESIIGVSISNASFTLGTSTNNFGFFTITLPQCESDTLVARFVGYQAQRFKIDTLANGPIEILLAVENNMTKAVVITDNNDPTLTNRMSLLTVPVDQLKKMPSLFGEADVMRVFQLMAGVQGGKEGTSGINVRGGSPDQNLYLLDDVPLYNVNHIGGFLSTFDASAIKNVELYKGAFPARYGGRLSSVLDIRMKDGNMKKRQGEYAVGTLAMKLNLQGPIKQDTSSYFFSLRRCNFDLLTRLAALMGSQGDVQTGYTFFDLYGKVNTLLNAKQRLYVTVYAGRDRIFINSNNKAVNPSEYSSKFISNIAWGNQMASVRLNHVFSSKMFGNTTLAFTRYAYNNNVSGQQAPYGSNDYGEKTRIQFTSGVTDLLVKQDFTLQVNDGHSLQFGVNVILHQFNQGRIKYAGPNAGTNSLGSERGNNLLGFENVAYVEDNIKLGEKTGFSVGVHLSNYNIQRKSFYSVQPRLLARRKLGRRSVVKGSFVTMKQYTHLLSSNGAGLPSDLWIPATSALPPSNCMQVALGLGGTLSEDKKWDWSAEFYLKKYTNLVEYQEGVSFFSNDESITDKVTNGGVGRVAGIDLQLQKLHGRTTGWCSYTLSKNDRRFDSLNNGNWFPFRYDRTHVATAVINHEINENISISATWMYSTGSPVTLAQQQYGAFNYFNYQNTPQETESVFSPFPTAQIYNGRNSSRMPAYHKLDLAINFTKQLMHGSRTWNISIFNAYNRQNPFYLFYRVDRADQRIKLYQLSIFPIIPSVSYTRQF